METKESLRAINQCFGGQVVVEKIPFDFEKEAKQKMEIEEKLNAEIQKAKEALRQKQTQSVAIIALAKKLDTDRAHLLKTAKKLQLRIEQIVMPESYPQKCAVISLDEARKLIQHQIGGGIDA